METQRPRQIYGAPSNWNLLLPRERQSPIGVSSTNESRAPLTGLSCVFPRRAIRQLGLAHLDSRRVAPSPPRALTTRDEQETKSKAPPFEKPNPKGCATQFKSLPHPPCRSEDR